MKRFLLPAAALAALAVPSAFAETIAAITDTNTLVTFDGDRPGEILSSQAVTGLAGGESILGIDVRPATGQLYALTSQNRLYTIDVNTAAATLVAALTADPTDVTAPYSTLSGTDFGIDFNPSVDRLRVVSDTGANMRVNPATAFVITDTPIAYAAGDAHTGQTPALVDAAYVNNTAGAASTTLFGVDFSLLCTKSLPDGTQAPAPCFVRIGGAGGVPSPNGGELTTIGPLGHEGITLRGFDVSASGRAYVAVTIATAPVIAVDLVEVDVATGDDVALGYVGDGNVAIRDIAVVPSVQFGAALYAAREGNTAVLVVSRSPAGIPMTVDYQTVNGSAIADRDYATARGTLSFAAADLTKTISIALPEDTIQEGDETFQVFLSDPAGGGFTLGSPGVATVRISPSDIADLRGPRISSFGLTGPSGGITGAVVRFDEDMDPASAVDLSNYTLSAVLKSGGKSAVAFNSAVYDPRERTVTLGAATPFAQPTAKGFVFSARGTAGGLKDFAGNLLDGKEKGKNGTNAAMKFKVLSGTTIRIPDSDGDVATLQISGGGRLDALLSVSRFRRRTQFWLVGAIPLSSTITGSVTTKPKSSGIVVIAEIIGLDKSEFSGFLSNTSISVSRLTFSTNATGL
jgi:hypothetical protein